MYTVYHTISTSKNLIAGVICTFFLSYIKYYSTETVVANSVITKSNYKNQKQNSEILLGIWRLVYLETTLRQKVQLQTFNKAHFEI
jgi:hypothetical protein